MIRNQWYVIEESKRIKKGKILALKRLGESLILWRADDGKVVCMKQTCPHLGGDLSSGKITDDHVVCPFHGFHYDAGGQCVRIPALGLGGNIPRSMRVKTYYVHEEHGLVWIYWGKSEEAPPPPLFFPSINEKFHYVSFRQNWKVHYSRMVENQLDVMHLPFVHHNTIGAGGRTVVDGPYVRLENDLLDLWTFNHKEDGRPARRASELPAPYGRPQLQFRFPNLWQNWISDNTRIMVAFVPVDENHTIMLGRFYDRSVKVPILREIYLVVGKMLSHYIASQDRQVVEHLVPNRADYHSGEKPVFTDNGVLTYRKRRQELLNGDPQKENRAENSKKQQSGKNVNPEKPRT